MNAVEFKKGIDNNKEKDIKGFLDNYNETYGESLENTVDDILEKYIADGSIREPLTINLINKKVHVKQGEWENIDTRFGYDVSINGQILSKHYIFPVNDGYEYESYDTVVVKKMLFWSYKIEVDRFKRRKIEKADSVEYSGLNWEEKEYFKKILTDKGFFVTKELGMFAPGLVVYWDKDYYDAMTK